MVPFSKSLQQNSEAGGSSAIMEILSLEGLLSL